MRTTTLSLISIAAIGLFIFGCGGGSDAKTPTTTNSSDAKPSTPTTPSPTDAKPADSSATPTGTTPPTKPDDTAAKPPTTSPTPAASDISGQWCGKQVTDAASCKGDDVFFADLKMSGENVTGEMCEAYKKDCYPLDPSTFKSNTFTLAYKFKQGTQQHSVTGSLQLGADGTLAGDFKTTKSKKTITKKLYKIK
jgi:hypothetical protein